MLTDVVSALVQADCFDQVLLVGREPTVLELGRQLGAEPLSEPGPSGYSAAAQLAADHADAAGAEALLIVPADLPLVRPADFVCFVERTEQAAVALVPSQGDGTNALLMRPPGVITYQFGLDSFETHLAAARRAGLATIVLDIPALRFDIDRPRDLRRLLGDGSLSTDTATWRFLADTDLAARLRPRAGSALPALGARVAAAPAPHSPS